MAKYEKVLLCKIKLFQERTILEGILDKFMGRFRFLTFDEKTNERLKEPNYFTAPFVAAYLEWCAFIIIIF